MNKKVLIVDDDKVILKMYVLKFQQGGFLVDTALGGKEALEKVESFQPDIILLDVVMYPLDGFDVLQQLNTLVGLQKKPRVVLLSNLGETSDLERGKELGAIDYIIKSQLTPQEVLERVEHIIGLSSGTL